MMSRSATRRGAFVVVVGPDGVGKTTAARVLLDLYPGPTAYFHFRPPVRRAMFPRPPIHSVPPPSKGSREGSKVLGWARLARNFAWFWLAYLARVRPAKRRGTLVVGDRWAYGYVAQPYALKYYGPPRLARLAVQLLPRPDLVANLTALPEVIHARKQELPLEAIAEELAVWRNLPAGRMVHIDAGNSSREVASAILGMLEGTSD